MELAPKPVNGQPTLNCRTGSWRRRHHRAGWPTVRTDCSGSSSSPRSSLAAGFVGVAVGCFCYRIDQENLGSNLRWRHCTVRHSWRATHIHLPVGEKKNIMNNQNKCQTNHRPCTAVTQLVSFALLNDYPFSSETQLPTGCIHRNQAIDEAWVLPTHLLCVMSYRTMVYVNMGKRGNFLSDNKRRASV